MPKENLSSVACSRFWIKLINLRCACIITVGCFCFYLALDSIRNLQVKLPFIENHNMGIHSSKPEECRSTIEVDVHEIIVANEEYDIACKLWIPSSDHDGSVRATALFLHGGMFSTGDLNSHKAVTTALVKESGLAVLTASFRDGSSTTFETGKTLSDLKALSSYMKFRFPKLPFGVIGSSSGGYFALLLCNSLNAGDVQFCIPLAPVANPLARAHYLKHCIDRTTPLQNEKDLYLSRHSPEKAQFILNNQLKFFESFKQMRLASEAVRENVHRIPTLLIVGGNDKNVPPNVYETVQKEWATRTIVLGLGVGHELQNEPPKEPHLYYIPDIYRFLKTELSWEESSSVVYRPWCR